MIKKENENKNVFVAEEPEVIVAENEEIIEEEIEMVVIHHKNIKYYATDKINGEIFLIKNDNNIGAEVGKIKNVIVEIDKN